MVYMRRLTALASCRLNFLLGAELAAMVDGFAMKLKSIRTLEVVGEEVTKLKSVRESTLLAIALPV